MRKFDFSAQLQADVQAALEQASRQEGDSRMQLTSGRQVFIFKGDSAEIRAREAHKAACAGQEGLPLGGVYEHEPTKSWYFVE